MKVKMDIQKLKQKLNEEKNKIGLVGGAIKIDEYDESEHNVSASISSSPVNSIIEPFGNISSHFMTNGLVLYLLAIHVASSMNFFLLFNSARPAPMTFGPMKLYDSSENIPNRCFFSSGCICSDVDIK